MKKGKSVSIRERNLHILTTETYKVRNDLGPEIWKDIFHFLQKPYTLQKQRNCTVYFGMGSIPYLASKIWETAPCQIKNPKSLDIFKEKVKLWTTGKCTCRLCKRKIGNVGFF